MTSHPLSKIYTKICASDGDKIIINLDIYPKARQFDNHHLTKVGKTIKIQVKTCIDKDVYRKTDKADMGKDRYIDRDKTNIGKDRQA